MVFSDGSYYRSLGAYQPIAWMDRHGGICWRYFSHSVIPRVLHPKTKQEIGHERFVQNARLTEQRPDRRAFSHFRKAGSPDQVRSLTPLSSRSHAASGQEEKANTTRSILLENATSAPEPRASEGYDAMGSGWGGEAPGR
jgi:hypothetical protein